MSLVASTVGVAGVWAVFWIQLPLLVLALAVTVGATIAMCKARPEDVPKMFAAFTSAFGRSSRNTRRNARNTERGEQ